MYETELKAAGRETLRKSTPRRDSQEDSTSTMTTITATLTQESAKAQLEQIIEAATVGAFPGGTAMNNAIYNNAALLLWAIQNSGTQDGDLVEVQNFVTDLQTQFAVGGAK